MDSPLALTQSAFRLGNTDWSFICSIDSVGSWYIKLLERRLLPFLPSFMIESVEFLRGGGALVLAAKDNVGESSREDRFAVLLFELYEAGGFEVINPND